MQKQIIVHTLITNKKREVLILERAKENDVLPEYWDIPGGTLEDGEDPMVGAVRETKEETGLDISHARIFFYSSNTDKVKNEQFITLVFRTEVDETNIILNPEEHQSYKWIEPSEITEYKTVYYLPNCLETYKEHAKTDESENEL